LISDSRNHDILLTGVPRSGTTLTCYLLNKLPDSVALNEPLPVHELDNRDEICDLLDRSLVRIRRSLLEKGTAVSKHVRGRVPDDPFDDVYPGALRRLADFLQGRRTFGPGLGKGLRRLRVSRGTIAVRKQLSSSFLLCIKHPPAFTALLDRLTQRFPCYAVVRNPLSVLASWNSCQMNMRNGRSPAAERIDRDLAQTLTQIDGRFDRQFYLLSWFFGKYCAILPPENVLRYEDIVASGGRALSAITARAAGLREALENRNANRLYSPALVLSLGQRLLKTDGPFWEFYSRQSVEQILEEIVK
jgi:hypothetical protein